VDDSGDTICPKHRPDVTRPLARILSKDLRWLSPFKSSKKARRVLSDIDWDETVLERARHCLSDLMKEKPTEVYAVALSLLRDPHKALPETIAWGMEDIIRSAARNYLLDPPLGSWNDEMDIRFEDYIRLTDYRRRCRTSLILFLISRDFVKETGTEWVWYNPKCRVCHRTTATSIVPVLGGGKYPTTWWVGYWQRVVPYVGERPSEETFANDPNWNSTLEALRMNCPTCYKAVVEEYPRFKEKILKIITDIIDDVSGIHF
jgi:hypothetical protein